MNREEARLLLDAWNFFDANPSQEFWIGLPNISNHEFYRLMPIVTGIESLVDAKIYLNQIAQGTISETVPGTIIEEARANDLPPSYVEDAKRATARVRAWIKTIKPKTADEVAERDVAAAQVKAELTRIEEKREKVPLEIEKETEIPEAPKERIAPAAPSSEEAVSVGIKITPGAVGAFQKFSARVATLPVRAAIEWSRPTLAKETPERAAALTLLGRGITSERLEKVETPAVKEKAALVKAVRYEEGVFPREKRLFEIAFPGKIDFLLSPESGLTQAEVAVYFGRAGEGEFSAVPRKSFLGNIISGAGQQLFGKLSSKFIRKATEKAVAKIATKAGIETALTAVSIPAGPAGWLARAALWVATEIGGKVLGFIKRNFTQIAGALLVAGGLLIGGSAGTVMAAGGGGVLLGPKGLRTVASGTKTFFTTLFSGALFPTLGIPLLISLIAVPVIVAIILFIINSGAYIVPPSDFSLAGDNPYISVVKEVSPEGPFANGDIPITVTYTITVTPRRGTLSGVEMTHDCQVISEGGISSCPEPLPDEIPTEISPSEPFVYTYSETYSEGRYRDSMVLNSFTVTADTDEVENTSATGAVSIIIGNPPTECYNVAGSWPATERANLLSAISNLVGNATPFVTRLCLAYSEVNLYYDPPNVCGLWGCAPGGNTIYFNSGGMGNVRNATYILAHESAHVLSYGNDSLFQAYRSYPGTLAELPVCSYGGGPGVNGYDAEGFAEAIAHYIMQSPCLSGNPNNIQFVQTHIFR